MAYDYDYFSTLPDSSKVVLVHIEPKQRVAVFSNVSGATYKKSIGYYVVGVSENGSALTEAASSTLSAGQWYYDHLTSEIYLRTSDDSNPKTKKIVLTYRLFFSNRAIDLPYDINSGSPEVNYDGRLLSNSPINKELDEEQIGIVLETSTNVGLENTDGHFDNYYDKLIFENKSIKVWSWSEILPLSEKRKLFDGFIQNKGFSDKRISFSCKDFTYQLRKPISFQRFTTSDGSVPEQYLNTPKRRLFGQLKQLQCAPIDATLEGFDLTGTVNASANTTTLNGVGTLFLDECSPEDNLVFESNNQIYRFTVKSVDSDAQITLGDSLDISLVSASLKVQPHRPYRKKNRRWHIAGHKLRQPTTTVVTGLQPNRFTASSTADLFSGDLIKVDGESVFIKRIVEDTVVLETNLQGGTPVNGDSVVKIPVSKAYIDGIESFIDRDWTVSNGASDAVLVLDNDVEFNLAATVDLPYDLTFTNASRIITVTGTDLKSEIRSRDWIRSDDITHTTWYEILDVQYDNDTGVSTVTIRTPYAGGTTTTNAQKKNVNLINDNSIITVNTLGQERAGAWVKTASNAVKDLLENDAGLTNIDTTSFAESDADAPYILSLAIPERLGSDAGQIKSVISKINESVFGSLTIDNDFNLKYQVLTPERPQELEQIKDDDIIGISSIRSRNEIVRAVNAKYSPYTDKFSGEEAFELYEFVNEFVDDIVGATEEMDKTLYLYNLDDATTIAQRYALYNSLSQSTVTVRGKLNLALKSLNDKVYLNLDRLYKRFAATAKLKIGIINKVSNDGKDVSIEINDLGNTFNRVGVVSSNTASDYSGADDDEKIRYSYIVDDDTLTPDTTSDTEMYANIIG